VAIFGATKLHGSKIVSGLIISLARSFGTLSHYN
jgi:hypothetical protein